MSTLFYQSDVASFNIKYYFDRLYIIVFCDSIGIILSCYLKFYMFVHFIIWKFDSIRSDSFSVKTPKIRHFL